MNRVVLIALVLFLSACGGSERRESKTPPKRSGGNDGVEIRVNDRGGSSSGGSGGETTRSEKAELSLKLTLPASSFDLGEAIPAVLELRNSGPKDITMYRPPRTLGGDFKLAIVTPRGRKSVIGRRLRVREESLGKEDLVVLRPGDRVKAEIDLGPELKDAGGGMLGEYHVTATFTGGYQGRHLSMDIWNREGTREVTAKEISVNLTWPEDLRVRGITPELDLQASMILGDTKPNGELREDARKLLAAMGKRIYPTLIHSLEQAESPRYPHQVIGWNAYHFLRDAGEDALEAVLKDEGRGPLETMLEGWLKSEQRHRLELPELGEEAVFRDEVGKPERRVKMVFRLTRSADEGRLSDTISINGYGLLSRELYEDGRAKSKSRKLTSEELNAFFLVLVNEKFWLQRAVREHGSAREPLLIMEQLRDAGGKQAPVRRIEVWESEVKLFNHALGKVVAAMQTLGESLKLEEE